jgi:CBS domain-containing protein
MPVRQLVTEAVMTVEMSQSASEVRAAMNRRDLHFATVCQGGRVTAVLDRRTLDCRLATAGRRLRVGDVVHPGMACLRPEAPLRAAARLMRVTGSDAVPVVDEHHHLLGLVTRDALTAAMAKAGEDAPSRGRAFTTNVPPLRTTRP